MVIVKLSKLERSHQFFQRVKYIILIFSDPELTLLFYYKNVVSDIIENEKIGGYSENITSENGIKFLSLERNTYKKSSKKHIHIARKLFAVEYFPKISLKTDFYLKDL